MQKNTAKAVTLKKTTFHSNIFSIDHFNRNSHHNFVFEFDVDSSSHPLHVYFSFHTFQINRDFSLQSHSDEIDKN